SVFWRINDAGKFLFNIQAQEQTIRTVSESIMREIIGQTPLQTALTEGRAAIESRAFDRIQEVLDTYESGVAITQVRLAEVDPPTSVIDAFRDVQAAQADRERLQNEAEAYQNDVIPRARGDAARLMQEAEAYREEVIARAQGEASRFTAVYEAYASDRDVTRQRIYLETMEQVMQGMNKIILDDRAGTGVVPYLPLPEIKRRRGE
ncbi:MAG: FtsH protease activity modulator HflK, partial [Sphingomonadales bacterium]